MYLEFSLCKCTIYIYIYVICIYIYFYFFLKLYFHYIVSEKTNMWCHVKSYHNIFYFITLYYVMLCFIESNHKYLQMRRTLEATFWLQGCGALSWRTAVATGRDWTTSFYRLRKLYFYAFETCCFPEFLVLKPGYMCNVQLYLYIHTYILW